MVQCPPKCALVECGCVPCQHRQLDVFHFLDRLFTRDRLVFSFQFVSPSVQTIATIHNRCPMIVDGCMHVCKRACMQAYTYTQNLY